MNEKINNRRDPKRSGVYRSGGGSKDRFDVVLTNPPFGTKGANQAPERDDFTVSTSNKQLNFLQHILTVLKPGGRAAVVLPDNCLFADQAGDVLKLLMEDCDVHTLLRLPNGTFTPYSPSTKTNVLFLTKGLPTERVWVYDARTNIPHITKQARPLKAEHFADFERCFGSDPNGKSKRKKSDSKEGRWREFDIEAIKDLKYKIEGLRWIQEHDQDENDLEFHEPEELATEALTELRLAGDELAAVIAELNEDSNGAKPRVEKQRSDGG